MVGCPLGAATVHGSAGVPIELRGSVDLLNVQNDASRTVGASVAGHCLVKERRSETTYFLCVLANEGNKVFVHSGDIPKLELVGAFQQYLATCKEKGLAEDVRGSLQQEVPWEVAEKVG